MEDKLIRKYIFLIIALLGIVTVATIFCLVIALSVVF